MGLARRNIQRFIGRLERMVRGKDLVFNGDEDIGGSGTPREGEPALGAMRFVQLEVG